MIVCMIAAIMPVAYQGNGPMSFHRPFKGFVQEYRPISVTEAMRRAERRRLQARDVNEMIQPFRRDSKAFAHLHSIWLAIRGQDGKWLFVDRRGMANNGGLKGRYDVVALEDAIARKTSLSFIRKAPILSVEISNHLESEVALLDSAGFERSVVPPGKSKVVRTWFTDHSIRSKGQTVGTIDALWKSSSASKGQAIQITIQPRGKLVEGHAEKAVLKIENKIL